MVYRSIRNMAPTLNTSTIGTDWDVVIVGGGPAGSATAIQLARCDPAAAGRTLLLDGAVFPRPKLCGGGVVRRADELLSWLEVTPDVPSVPIHAIRYMSVGGATTQHMPDSFRVVRREDFDHALLRAARAHGVTVREGERVLGFTRETAAIRIRTTRTEYRARVVVGADGARSLVRRALVGDCAPQRFVTVEVLTDEHAPTTPEFRDHMAVFDFRSVPDGLRGYAWDFPSWKGGRAVMNRGIGGTEWSPALPLKRALAARLRDFDVPFPAATLEGAAVPLYHPSTRQSVARALLVGDAVGIDPLMGEGISVAIGTGMVAAHAIADALRSRDCDFDDYGRRLADSAVGWMLRRNWLSAGVFYRRLKNGSPVEFPAGGLS